MTDITDTLLKETREVMDKIGFSFLQEQGYACDPKDKASIDATRKQLKKDGMKLVYNCEKREDGYLIWFAIKRGKKMIARSSGLKLQYREDQNGREESQG